MSTLANPKVAIQGLLEWKNIGLLRSIDYYQAQMIYEQSSALPKQAAALDKDGQADLHGIALIIMAVLSKQVGDGHVCLNIRSFVKNAKDFVNPDRAAMASFMGRTLNNSSSLSAIESVLSPEALTGALTNTAFDHAEKPHLIISNRALHNCLQSLGEDGVIKRVQLAFAVGNEHEASNVRPFYIKGERLYLQRFYHYEQQIAKNISARLPIFDALSDAKSHASQVLRQAIKVLFTYSDTEQARAALSQRVACAIASRAQFSVITGGPGTGKTTTVVKLLAALQAISSSQQLASGLLKSQDIQSQPKKLRIALAAPTGKAAARLNQSINEKVSELPFERLPGQVTKEDIPVKVTTLHQLLGSRFNSRQFVHNAKNTLPLDVLVIDEASMVDVDMMASVFGALPKHASLILIGDKDQLASVDAGAVLGDLAQVSHLQQYTPQTVDWLASVLDEDIEGLIHLHETSAKSQLHDLLQNRMLQNSMSQNSAQKMSQNIAVLNHSYRFDESSGIKALASEVNSGELSEDLLSRFSNAQLVDSLWLAKDINATSIGNANYILSQNVIEHIKTGSPDKFLHGGQNRMLHGHTINAPVAYRHYLSILRNHSLTETDGQEAWDSLARRVLHAFDKFRVLCAMREGPWGTQSLNKSIEQALITSSDRNGLNEWYQGRPVLITKNDYNLNLMNGDIGIAINTGSFSQKSSSPNKNAADTSTTAGSTNKMRVAFFSNDGSDSIRWFSVNRLQHLQTAFAMTVHKSQGSEFEHACLVMPDQLNPVLTKELVYTAITRSKLWFSLITPQAPVFEKAVKTKINRDSGLLVDL